LVGRHCSVLVVVLVVVVGVGVGRGRRYGCRRRCWLLVVGWSLVGRCWSSYLVVGCPHSVILAIVLVVVLVVFVGDGRGRRWLSSLSLLVVGWSSSLVVVGRLVLTLDVLIVLSKPSFLFFFLFSNKNSNTYRLRLR
jgi:hypothetical protein